MYLTDTNVISEIRKGNRCDANVSAWYAGVTVDDIFLSVLVLGEIRRGVERIRGRDPRRYAILENWLLEVASRYARRVLAVYGGCKLFRARG